jgi:hypothetical protein
MLEVGGDADFGEEALDAKHRAEVWIEHFHRDSAIVLDVARQVHGRHPAAANFAVEQIPIGEGSVQLRKRIHL